MKLTTVLLLLVCVCSLSERANAQKKKKRDWTPHYQQPGKFSLGLEWFALTKPTPLSPPISIVPEITVVKNLSVSAFFNFYYFRTREDDGYYSKWMDDKKYSVSTPGLKLTYHLASAMTKSLGIKMKPNKVDPYISLLGGYSFISKLPDQNKLTAGALVGVRYFYSKKLGFYIQGGYSDLGYISLGFSWVLSEMR